MNAILSQCSVLALINPHLLNVSAQLPSLKYHIFKIVIVNVVTTTTNYISVADTLIEMASRPWTCWAPG